MTELSIDKSNWTKVKFGDVVFEPKESVKDARAEGIEHVVGLEHIDSEDIHLRRSNSIDESTTFTKKFSEGDVLFGRRRAYLKKAAQASFSGICSGDITVMRANDKLMPELLPFLVNNDKFFDWAVKHSAGGLSPRVKFKDLASYEFHIPPRDIQSKIAELFLVHDAVTEKWNLTAAEILEVKSAVQRSYFDYVFDEYIEIGSFSKVFSGGTPNRKIDSYWGGDIPWVKTAEVSYQVILDTEEKITQSGLNNSAAKLIKPNSVLVAMYGQGVTRGRVALTGTSVSCNQASAVIEPSGHILAEFIYYYLEYKYEELRALAHGANQQNLNLKMIKSFQLPNFSKEMQDRIIGDLSIIQNNYSDVSKHIQNASTFQKSLINQVF